MGASGDATDTSSLFGEKDKALERRFDAIREMLANEAAAIPLGLMSSNKDRLPAEPPPAPPAATVDPLQLSDQTLQELLRAKQGA